MATVGDRIREARERSRTRQRELAQALGVTDKTISHWEVGFRTPSFDDIVNAARFFHIPPRDLLDGVDNVTLRISDADTIQLLQTFSELDPFFRKRFLDFANHFGDIAREAKAQREPAISETAI